MSTNNPENQPNQSRFSRTNFYLARLYTKLPGYAERAALVPPNAPGSVEWLGRVGKFWWEAREAEKLTRRQAAEQIPTDPDYLMFFELGMSEPEVARGDFPQRYAAALKKPELYEKFCERFEITPYQPTPEE